MKPAPFAFKLTCEYSEVDEIWKKIKRYSLHERISFRGLHKGTRIHITWSNWKYEKPLTKEQKLVNYECRMLENGKRPYHYTDKEWEDVQREYELEEYVNRCEAKETWRYEL